MPKPYLDGRTARFILGEVDDRIAENADLLLEALMTALEDNREELLEAIAAAMQNNAAVGRISRLLRTGDYVEAERLVMEAQRGLLGTGSERKGKR